MQYTQGNIGRIFLLKFSDDEILLEKLSGGKSKVFLVIEAIIFELKGVKATKSIDLKTGLNLLKIL